MLVQCQQRPQGRGVDRIHGEHAAGPVARHRQVRRQARRLGLVQAALQQGLPGGVGGPAYHQGAALGQAVGHQAPVLFGHAGVGGEGQHEVGGAQQRALVQQLVKGVLPDGAGGAPQHRRGGVGQLPAVAADPLAVALHGQLLQEVRQFAQAVIVGQHHVVAGAEEIAVPQLQQAHQRRHIGLQRAAMEMLVHGLGPRQELFEVLPAHGDRAAQPHGRPHGVAPAHPVPHGQAVGCRNPEVRGGLQVAGDGEEMPVQVGDTGAGVEHPVAGREAVGKGLLGAEGFRADDKQGGAGIQFQQRILQVGGVHIGHVVAADVAVEGAQGLADQAGAQVGTADADIDHIGDDRAGKAALLPVVEPLRPLAHLRAALAHLVELGIQSVAAGCPQQGVQRGPVLGVVDLVAVEQGGDSRRQPRLFGQAQEPRQGRPAQQVFTEIQPEAGGREGEVPGARRVRREQFFNGRGLQLGGESLQWPVVGQFRQQWARCHAITLWYGERMQRV